MKKMTPKQVAKSGASARWRSRYEAIEELRKYADSKAELDQLMRLKTKTLEWILKTIQYIKQ